MFSNIEKLELSVLFRRVLTPKFFKLFLRISILSLLKLDSQCVGVANEDMAGLNWTDNK